MPLLDKLYLKTTEYLMERRNEIVRPYLRGDVLDIGCGKEAYLAHFVDKRHIYVGIDGDDEVIQVLERYYQDIPNYKFHCVNFEKENELAILKHYSPFTTITMLAVIEHLRNPDGILRLCAQMLKADGNLVLTTPTAGGDKIWDFLQQCLLRGRGYPFPHVKIYNKHSLITLLERSNFRIDTCKKFEAGMNMIFVCSKNKDR